MALIRRDDYNQWLNEFRKTKLVKVLTGLRRSGKSTILEMYMQSLMDEGVAQLFVNRQYAQIFIDFSPKIVLDV